MRIGFSNFEVSDSLFGRGSVRGARRIAILGRHTTSNTRCCELHEARSEIGLRVGRNNFAKIREKSYVTLCDNFFNHSHHSGTLRILWHCRNVCMDRPRIVCYIFDPVYHFTHIQRQTIGLNGCFYVHAWKGVGSAMASLSCMTSTIGKAQPSRDRTCGLVAYARNRYRS
jgi:hypothetical protein